MIYKPLHLYDTRAITMKIISFVSFYVRQQLGQSNAHNNIIIKYTYKRYQDQDHHAVEASPLLVCIQLECTVCAHSQDKTA